MIITCPNCGCKYNLTRKPPVTFHCRKCSFTIPFNILLNEANKNTSMESTSSSEMGNVTNSSVPQSPIGSASTIVEKKTKGILQITFNGKNFGTINLPHGNFFNLGRLSLDGTATIKLTPDIAMSRIHAGMRTVMINGELVYQINSAKENNPVFVNGKPIAKGKAFNLKSGDTLKMGDTTMVFRMV